MKPACYVLLIKPTSRAGAFRVEVRSGVQTATQEGLAGILVRRLIQRAGLPASGHECARRAQWMMLFLVFHEVVIDNTGAGSGALGVAGTWGASWKPRSTTMSSIASSMASRFDGFAFIAMLLLFHARAAEALMRFDAYGSRISATRTAAVEPSTSEYRPMRVSRLVFQAR